MTYNEDDLIQLSALQHFMFCERQCALIHIKQLWSENLFTAEGRIMHDKVDTANREVRGKVRIDYGVPLRSVRLGLIGKADVVEFHKKDGGGGCPFLLNTSVENPRWMTATRFSFALRRYALKKCLMLKLMKERFFTGRPGAGRTLFLITN